jgi:3-hydroxyacyl-[acyl-carrier-protein] dehydratase
MSSRSIEAMLPHRPPFLFITESVAVDSDQAKAVWRIDGSEGFFTGHFPGNPIVPGVLVTEALAQTAGLVVGCRCAGSERSPRGFLAKVDMKFPTPAKPPCHLVLMASCTHEFGALYRFDVSASVSDATIAVGELVLSVPGAGVADPDVAPGRSGATPR